jgi:hypothetical protein
VEEEDWAVEEHNHWVEERSSLAEERNHSAKERNHAQKLAVVLGEVEVGSHYSETAYSDHSPNGLALRDRDLDGPAPRGADPCRLRSNGRGLSGPAVDAHDRGLNALGANDRLSYGPDATCPSSLRVCRREKAWVRVLRQSQPLGRGTCL